MSDPTDAYFVCNTWLMGTSRDRCRSLMESWNSGTEIDQRWSVLEQARSKV
jgi:hypothetical protein